MAIIISGKEVSANVRAEVKAACEQLRTKGITPGLAVIIVGDDPASRVYVNNKKKACADVGFVSEEYALPAETTQEELLALIDTLNRKPEINGILCQLPLPKHLDEKAVINAISSFLFIGLSSTAKGIVVICPLFSAIANSLGGSIILIASSTTVFPIFALHISAANKGVFNDISSYFLYNACSSLLLINTLALTMVSILSKIFFLSLGFSLLLYPINL